MFRVYYVWKSNLLWRDVASYEELTNLQYKLKRQGAHIKMIRNSCGEKI